jgi:hypothetical protein
MTSTSSAKTDPLIEALTAHEYNDVTGVVPVNVTEALLAIAHAIDRLAIVHERGIAQAAQTAQFVAVLFSQRTDKADAPRP